MAKFNHSPLAISADFYAMPCPDSQALAGFSRPELRLVVNQDPCAQDGIKRNPRLGMLICIGFSAVFWSAAALLVL